MSEPFPSSGPPEQLRYDSPVRPPQTGTTSALSRQTAWVLDKCLKIPGTTARIGLDPLIGLIPGVGDALSTFMGGVILAEALRRGVPGPLLLRIGGNMLLNAAIGALPVVGDLFSAWFKSNSKNHALLEAFLAGNPSPPASPQSKWVLAGFILFMAVLAGLCVLAFWLLAKLWQMIRNP